jgi:hypothetical protein
MNFLKRWVGAKEPSSTLTSSENGSCCEKYDKQILKKLALLVEENRRLKEEIRLLKASMDKTHDV